MKCCKAKSLAALALALAMTVGCSRQPVQPGPDENAAGDQQLPFDRASDKKGISPTGSLMPAAIPAGTPITIRLQSSVSSAASHAGDSFEAVLDEPIIVQGQTVGPRGTAGLGGGVGREGPPRPPEPGP